MTLLALILAGVGHEQKVVRISFLSVAVPERMRWYA